MITFKEHLQHIYEIETKFMALMSRKKIENRAKKIALFVVA